MGDVWILPVLPAAAFVLLLLFSPWLPRKGDWLAIVAMLAAFVLVIAAGKDMADAIARRPRIPPASRAAGSGSASPATSTSGWAPSSTRSRW